MSRNLTEELGEYAQYKMAIAIETAEVESQENNSFDFAFLQCYLNNLEQQVMYDIKVARKKVREKDITSWAKISIISEPSIPL